MSAIPIESKNPGIENPDQKNPGIREKSGMEMYTENMLILVSVTHEKYVLFLTPIMVIFLQPRLKCF